MIVHVGRYYQHRYGGLYIVNDISTSTVDQSKWVVYAHCYPFEYQVWHRPYEEFIDGRFTLLTREQYNNFVLRDREEFRREITANKAAAKKDK